MEKKTDGKQDEKLFFLKLSEILFRENYIKETEELVDKMRKSKYAYVYPDHYKHAIEKMIDNLSFKYDLEKYRDKDDEERDFER